MSAYVRLVESLLVEMGQKGRYKERQATKLRQQDAEAAAGARNPTPLDPIPSPVDRSGPGGASGGTDELGNAIKTNAQKDAEKAKADAEKEEKPEVSPEQARKADALKATGPWDWSTCVGVAEMLLSLWSRKDLVQGLLKLTSLCRFGPPSCTTLFFRALFHQHCVRKVFTRSVMCSPFCARPS